MEIPTRVRYNWERDALLAHGAAYFLKERLTDLSDAIKTAVCGKCGCLAAPKSIEKVIRCNNCNITCTVDDPDSPFGQITIPYAFSLLRNLIAGLNIQLKFSFATQDYVVAQDMDVMEELEDEEKGVFSGDNEDEDVYKEDEDDEGELLSDEEDDNDDYEDNDYGDYEEY